MKTLQYGSSVIYVDEHSREHNAIVTETWAQNARAGEREYDENNAQLAINLVYVSDNEAERDSCGRQIKRETSVVHRSGQSAPGRFWYQP